MRKLVLAQVTQELENQYEHRLAVELDRYDKLSEELEASQQRYYSIHDCFYAISLLRPTVVLRSII
jgi:hypothetical protein